MATRSTGHHQHISTSPHNDCNTPWWYQTPSLASQTTYNSSYLTGPSQMNYPFTITPSQTQSSGYCDDSTIEGDGSMLTDSTAAATYGHHSSSDGGAVTDWSGQRRLASVLPSGHGHHGGAVHVCRQCHPQGTHEDQPSSLCTHHSQLTSAGTGPQDGDTEYGFTINSSIYVSPSSTSCGENISQPDHDDLLSISTTGAVEFTGTLVSEDQSPRSTLTSVFDSNFEESQSVRIGYNGGMSEDSHHQHQRGMFETSPSMQDGSYREHGTSPQSFHSGGSQLSHAMSSAEQEVLHYLAPQLMQYMNTADLLPLLKQYNLLTEEDVEFIQSSHRSEKDRRQRILNSASFSCPGAFDRFIECLGRETTHSGHAYLARRLSEALERKKENPFKRLSSLRSNRRPSPSSPHSDVSATSTGSTTAEQYRVKKSPQFPHQSAAASYGSSSSTSYQSSAAQNSSRYEQMSYSNKPVVATSIATTSSRPQNYENISYSSRQQPSLSSSLPRSTHTDGVPPSVSAVGGAITNKFYWNESNLTWESQPGDFSSFPRQVMHQNRGSKAYSSARFSTASTDRSEGDSHRRKKVSRNASFTSPTHHSTGVNNLVSPLARHPSTVHEEDLVSEMADSAYYSTITAHSSGNNYARTLSFPGSSSTTGAGTGGSGSDGGHMGRKSASGGQIPMTSFEIGPSMISGGSSSVLGSRGNDGQSYMYGQSPPQQFPSASLTDDFSSHDHTTQQSRVSYTSACSENPHASSNGSYPSLSRGQHPPRGGSYNDFRSNFNPLSSIDSSTTVSESPSESQQSSNLSSPSKNLSWIKVHRRSQSCDASKSLERDQLTLSMEKSRHHSLKRKSGSPSGGEPQHLVGHHGNYSMSQPVPSSGPGRHSTSPYVNVQLKGSQSGHELSSDSMSFTRRRLQWLQEKVNFTDFYEDIFFDSLTHYEQNRDILYSGTLYERGKPRFMVLLTDMLLVLKPKKKMNIVQSKIGRMGIQLDWFSDQECKTKKPLMLHLLSVQRQAKKQSGESFYIHYNRDSTMVEICLHAVSKAAKEIWVDALEEAIRCSTNTHAENLISVGQQIKRRPSSSSLLTKLTLTVVEANNLALLMDTKTKNHFCVMELGGYKCRTPSIRAKCWPTWNFKCDFTDFQMSDALHVTFHTERTVCPDDFLGFVKVNLMSLVRKKQPGNTNKLLFRNQSFSLQQGKGTITLHLELSLS